MNKANWEAKEGFYEQIRSIRLEELPDFLRDHREDLLTGPRPFSDYMRARFRDKGMLQQNVFLAADISENYGYKLIAEEKHTVQRDIILRICLAAQFDLNETQKALILYGMAPLFWLLPRDLVFMAAIVHKAFDIHQVNEILIRCGQTPMVKETE